MTRGFTCTSCNQPTGVEPDTTGLTVDAIIVLCEHWRCDDCLDIHEAEEAAHAARSTTAEAKGSDYG